jgi:hypothetical protein
LTPPKVALYPHCYSRHRHLRLLQDIRKAEWRRK